MSVVGAKPHAAVSREADRITIGRLTVSVQPDLRRLIARGPGLRNGALPVVMPLLAMGVLTAFLAGVIYASLRTSAPNPIVLAIWLAGLGGGWVVAALSVLFYTRKQFYSTTVGISPMGIISTRPTLIGYKQQFWPFREITGLNFTMESLGVEQRDGTIVTLVDDLTTEELQAAVVWLREAMQLSRPRLQDWTRPPSQT